MVRVRISDAAPFLINHYLMFLVSKAKYLV
jgi:hypothetical protein